MQFKRQILIFFELVSSATAFVASRREIRDFSLIDEELTAINRNHNDLLEGDIVPDIQEKNAFNYKRFLWPGAKVPITYGSTLSLDSLAAVEEAITEFALQTCVRITNRTDETDFVILESLDGCWSKVGKSGGNQTMSMGNRCQYKGTAIHEFLHAIGLFHEQSRKDRDDYIEIQLSKIISDMRHNFDKMYLLDNLRHQYDLGSIMHYRDIAFSADDSTKTILTRDPNLQEMISFSKDTFSEIDVAKVNRLYDCGDTVLHSYHCDFDKRTICGWVSLRSSWHWIDLANRTQPKNQSFPKVDGTHDKPFKGGYLYSTGNAIMKSMLFKTKVRYQCLQLWYFLDANTSAEVSIDIAYVNDFTGEIVGVIGKILLNVGVVRRWAFFRGTIVAPAQYRILINSQLRDNGFVAVDDFNVVDRACDTAYFVFPSIASLLAQASESQFQTSATALTQDGYPFNIRIYLNGTTEFNRCVILVFFSLVPDARGENRSWPHENRYVRLNVMDQHSNPLRAQHRSRAFIDLSRDGPLKISYLGGPVMRAMSLFGSRQYVKHDTLIVSVSVRDMSAFANGRGKKKPNPGDNSGSSSDSHKQNVTSTIAITSTPASTEQSARSNASRMSSTTPATPDISSDASSTPYVLTSESSTGETNVTELKLSNCADILFGFLPEKTAIYILVILSSVLMFLLVITCCSLKRYRTNNIRHKTRAAIRTGMAQGTPRIEVFSVRNKLDRVREGVAEEYLNSEYTVMMGTPTSSARPSGQSLDIPLDLRAQDAYRSQMSSFSSFVNPESSPLHANSPIQG